MKEKGRVLEKKDGRSLVQIIRTSACSHCDEKCMLAEDSHEMEEMEVEVNDPIGADVGSMVELEMGTKPILFSAFVVYLIPLVLMIVGYFIAQNLFSFLFTSAELAGIIGSIISFFLSFFVLRAFDKKAGSKSYFHPEITRVITDNGFFYNK